MKPKTTLALFVAVLALGAFIYFDFKKPSTNEQEANSRRFIKLDRADINKVRIKTGGQTVEIKKEGTVWKMISPTQDRADSFRVNQLLDVLDALQVEQTIPAAEIKQNPALIADFGLESPAKQVEISGPKKTVVIAFGKPTAIEGRLYARIEGDDSVKVVRKDAAMILGGTGDDFRDPRLADMTPAEVDRISIKSPGGELEVVKADDLWSLVKPMKARVDTEKMEDLIGSLLNARIVKFVGPDSVPLEPYGLTTPVGTVTVSSGQPDGMGLDIGTEGHTIPASPEHPEIPAIKTIYARVAGRSLVCELQEKVAAFTSLKPADLRDKKLLNLPLDLVDRIQVSPAGSPAYTLIRKEDAWHLNTPGSPALNRTEVERFLTLLTSAEASAFVSDFSSDPAQYGLKDPSMQVKFNSFSSSNTAESVAGEQEIATLIFGKTEGGSTFARLKSEPFVIAVPEAVTSQIPANPARFKPLEIFQVDPVKITEMTLSGTDRVSVTIRRDGKKWVLAEGDGILNEAATETLAGTLGKLKAVEWKGDATPTDGFDQPLLRIDFLVEGSTEPRTLLLGKSTPQGMTYAALEGEDDAFLLSRPDYELLTAALISR